MGGKELVEIVEWNELQEICKAMQSICRDRQKWNELCYSPHPDKQDNFVSCYRLDYDRIIKRIYLTYNMALSRLAIRAREKGLFGNTGLSLEEALTRFLPVTTYKFGNTPRQRLLIDSDIARGNEYYAMPVYSDVLDDDNDLEPRSFEYIKENIYEEKYKNVGKLKYCCDCVGVCDVSTCSCILRDRQMNFGNIYSPADRRFVLQEESQNDYVNDMTIEATRIMCGPECSCNKDCFYRYDNIPAIHKFEVFKRDSQLGFGLRVLNNVKQGEPIIEFAGLVKVSPSYYTFTKKELEEFNNYSYQVSSRFWKTEIDQAEVLKKMNHVFPELKSKLEKYRPKNAFIMPHKKGNAGRFISHGCLPNCLLMRVAVNDLRLEKHRILIVANEDIPAGSELFIDYGQKMEEEVESRRPKRRAFGRKRRRGPHKKVAKNENPAGGKCKCGTVLCRENLPVLARIMEGVTLKDTWKPCHYYAKNLRNLTELRLQQFGQWLKNNGSVQSVEPGLDPEELQKQIRIVVKDFMKPDTTFRKLDDPEVEDAHHFKIQRTVQRQIVHLSDDEDENDTEVLIKRPWNSEVNADDGTETKLFLHREAKQENDTPTSSSRSSPESAESVVSIKQPLEDDDDIVCLGDTLTGLPKVKVVTNSRTKGSSHVRRSPTLSNSSSSCSTVASTTQITDAPASSVAAAPSSLTQSMMYGPFTVPIITPAVRSLKRNSMEFMSNGSPNKKTNQSNQLEVTKPTSYKSLVMHRIKKEHNSLHTSSNNEADKFSYCMKMRPAPPPWPRQKEGYF